jgi:hypothetical protein
MNTLQMLRNGQLTSATRLSLSCELKTFPEEIFDLADSLEILDLSNNKLSALPDDLGRLKKLRILFLSENEFKEIPKVLAQCSELTMIGFKSNQISLFPENALPLKVQWLILTDNKIEKLPDSIGKLTKLQKCMLAGNRLHSLPNTMAACKNLELLRISANQIERLPSWLFALPRLSWLACAGNPFINKHLLQDEALKEIHWNDIILHEELGRGASGVISRASLFEREESFAIKIFKGDVTSDGYPVDEMQACITAGMHDNLTTLHGKFHEHPEDKEGLVLSLIPPSYNNLGNSPDFDTCTRDTYDENTFFVLSHILRIANEIASASAHLHSRKIMHGDLYSHNILINEHGHSLLGDFGAATLYENIDDIECESFERLEVRAFGCLLEDMLDRCKPEDLSAHKETAEALSELKQLCMNEKVSKRPLFRDISKLLLKI